MQNKSDEFVINYRYIKNDKYVRCVPCNKCGARVLVNQKYHGDQINCLRCKKIIEKNINQINLF